MGSVQLKSRNSELLLMKHHDQLFTIVGLALVEEEGTQVPGIEVPKYHDPRYLSNRSLVNIKPYNGNNSRKNDIVP